MTPPPAHAEQASQPSADCSTSRAAPIVDGIVTGYQVVRTLYATQAPDDTYQGAPIGRGADIGLGLSFTALFLASTIYGAVNTSECRDFKARTDEQERRKEREQLESVRARRRSAPPEPEAAPAVDEPLTPAPPAGAPAAPASAAPGPTPSAAPPSAPPTAAPSPFKAVPKPNGAFPP